MIQTPHLAVDGIIRIYNHENEFLGIVLIKRKNKPFGLALPGGFVDIGEKVEDALKREMLEEVTLNVEKEKLFNVYSDPDRDKRFHCVSIVYECCAYKMPKAADDAKEAYIFAFDDIPFDDLVFDHKRIIEDYIKNSLIL